MAKINYDIIMTDKEKETNKECKIPKKVFEGGQIGIKNLGNTCYMSSALQCLFHTEELVEYFFSKEYKNDLFNYGKSICSKANNNDNVNTNCNLNNNSNFGINYSNENNFYSKNSDDKKYIMNFKESDNINNNFKNNVDSENSNNENSSNEINIELDVNNSSYNIHTIENSKYNLNNSHNNKELFEKTINENKLSDFANLKSISDENIYINNVELKSNYKNPKEKNEKEKKKHLHFEDEDLIVLSSNSASRNDSGMQCHNNNNEIYDNQKQKEPEILMDIDCKNEACNKIESLDKNIKGVINEENKNENNKEIENVVNFCNNDEQDIEKINDFNKNKNPNSSIINDSTNNNADININNNNENENKTYILKQNSTETNPKFQPMSENSEQTKKLSSGSCNGGSSLESKKTLPSIIPLQFQHDDEKEKQLILFTQNFKDLIQKMWSKGAELINPKEFRESLICLNSQFNNYSQQDAHELLTFILESLHVKLNRGPINLNSQSEVANLQNLLLFNNEDQNFNLNLNLNKTQSILNWENHVYFNDSIINDYFYGLLLSSLTCKKCQSTNFTYEPFNHLGLSIPNEFHLFIYFLPDFSKGFFDSTNENRNNSFTNNNGVDCNRINFNNKGDKIEVDENKDNYFEEIKVDAVEEKFVEKNNSNSNKKKSFPKAVKMYIKINDNMQFKNIIDTVSERLNYPIENGVFYSVLDNQVTRIIESDERCGELMQRNFFLFLAETKKEEIFKAKDFNLNNSNNNDKENKAEKHEINDMQDYNCELLNGQVVDNYNSNCEFNESLDGKFRLFVNFNFCSFPEGKFNLKQKANPISYPRIFDYKINSNSNFIFSILNDLLKYAEIIFQKKTEKENNFKNYDKNTNELNNSGSKRPSSRYSNDSASENNHNNKSRNKKKNNSKNKKLNEANKSNLNNSVDYFNKEEKNKSFLDEISITKIFIICNKAVLLEDSNTFFTTENTQEKFQLINNSINNSNKNNANATERIGSRIKTSLLTPNRIKTIRENIHKKNNNNKTSEVLNKSPINKLLKDKFICLFCSSVNNSFFYCDCLNEFIIKNQIFFEQLNLNTNSQKTNNNYNNNNKNNNYDNKKKNTNQISIKNQNNLNFSSLIINLHKIKKNFLQNFLNYSKENENQKKQTSKLLAEISLFTQEDYAKDSFRLLNACKDLTALPQKDSLITLNDLLEYFTAEEKLREEKFFCLTCNEWISRVKRLEINKFPNILVINFKRFRYDIIQPKGRSTRRALESQNNYSLVNFNGSNANNLNNTNNNNFSYNNLSFGGEKNENKIDFPFDLDLSKFNRYGESTKYELYAVCNHEGKISGGHYKAVCKDFQSSKWFEFDDKIVKQISENMIVSHKAYILFYRRKKE